MKELTICCVGGLANRMRAMAAGISLARHCNTPYKLIWPVNSDLRCEFSQLFELNPIQGNVKDISGIGDLFLYDLPRKRNAYLSPFLKLGRYDIEFHDGEELESLRERPELLVDRCMATSGKILIRSGSPFYKFDPLLYRQLFSPRPELLAQARRRVNDRKDVIGIHIRRTDNTVAIEHSPLYLFEEAVDREIHINPDACFYLATDDPETKRYMMNKYGGRIICSDQEATRNSVKGMKEGLVEMLTLASCSKIYGTYWSSFSEAAAMLGDTTLIQRCNKNP